MCVQLRQLRLFNAAEDEAAPGEVAARLFAGAAKCRLSPPKRRPPTGNFKRKTGLVRLINSTDSQRCQNETFKKQNSMYISFSYGAMIMPKHA